MKEVLIVDRNWYWRPNSCGYTNSAYEAGLYTEDQAKIIIEELTERRMSTEDPPPNHPTLLLRKISELEQKVEELQLTIVGLHPSF